MDKPIEFKGIKKNNKNFVLNIQKDKNEINIKYSLENPLSKEDVEKINKILDGTPDYNEIMENIKNIVNSYPIFNNERGTILPVMSFGGLRKDFELAAGIMKILENEKIEEIIK